MFISHRQHGGNVLRGATVALVIGLGIAATGIGPSSHADAQSLAIRKAAAPCIPAGHSTSTIPSISFGRSGGNIRPFTVNIYGDGVIAYKGAVTPPASYAIRPDAVLGLKTLASAEGFATWPAVIKSTRLFPDSASLFVTIRAGCATTTSKVTMRPGANQPSFLQLWDTLYAAAGLGAN
jgi:hypothetical protein